MGEEKVTYRQYFWTVAALRFGLIFVAIYFSINFGVLGIAFGSFILLSMTPPPRAVGMPVAPKDGHD